MRAATRGIGAARLRTRAEWQGVAPRDALRRGSGRWTGDGLEAGHAVRRGASCRAGPGRIVRSQWSIGRPPALPATVVVRLAAAAIEERR